MTERIETIITGYGYDNPETHDVINRRVAEWYTTAQETPSKTWTEFYYNGGSQAPRFVVFARFSA